MTEETLEAPRGRSLSRTVLILGPAVAFFGLLVFAVLQKGEAPVPGSRAPEFSGPLLDGEGSLALSDLEGKPVFLNFWWSGCEPCKEEAPLIDEAQRVYGDEVAFVGINVRDARSDAISFAEENGLDFPHVRDETFEIYDDYALTGQPESFFIDGEGVVVEHVAGPVSEEQLDHLLDILVARSG
ncbi:MAG: TlpA family protein disulfide reductase [Actinomycetota bacterium]|nr:TlpA family protein disulfide reductase [Actinomycetota bacterium]